MDIADVSQPPVGVSLRGSAGDATRERREARARRRLRIKRLRQAVLASVLLAVVAGATFALLPKPMLVDAVRVARGPLLVEVRESGQTRVKDRYLVSSPVAGSLVRLALTPNDAVQEGGTLAQIAPTPPALLDPRTRAEGEARVAAAQSALKHADAEVALARTSDESALAELARSRALDRAGALPERSLEQSEFLARLRTGEVSSAIFARKVAAEQVRLARAALEPRTAAQQPVDVLSPVSGNVLRVLRESAAVVAAGTPLLEVGDLAGLEVVVDLLTTDATQVRPGTPVVIEGFGGEHELAGRVRKVELAAFTRPSALGVDEQRANVIAVFSDPRERWAVLGDGYRVEVRIALWQGRDVVKVPHGAVFRRGDGWSAFRIDAGVAKLVPVRIGHRSETELEILDGLEPGSVVVVDPGDHVEDGVRVAAR